MKEKLEQIKAEALRQIEASEALDRLNEVRVNYLGKKGELTAVPSYKSQTVTDSYTDNGNTFSLGRYCEYYQSFYGCPGGQPPSTYNPVDLAQYGYSYSNTLQSSRLRVLISSTPLVK